MDRGAERSREDRSPRRPHAHLERVGLLRRLRTSHGTRLGASRPPLLRDARRSVARIPAARAQDGARADGREGRRPPAHEPRRSLGGERVLARAVVAHRSRWEPRNSGVRRVREESGRAAHHRRVLRLDLRELCPRAARGGGARRPDAAGLHASLRRVRGDARRRPPSRGGGARPRARGQRGVGLRTRVHPGPQTAGREPFRDGCPGHR